MIDLQTIILLVPIFIHIAASIWWASDITARIKHLERRADLSAPIEARMAAVEASLKSNAARMDQIGRSLESIEKILMDKGPR